MRRRRADLRLREADVILSARAPRGEGHEDARLAAPRSNEADAEQRRGRRCASASFWAPGATVRGEDGEMASSSEVFRRPDSRVTRDREPWLAVEAKLGDHALSPAFGAFLPHVGCKRFVQVVKEPNVRTEATVGDARGPVMNAADFLSFLP
jgi:hypothetical protein